MYGKFVDISACRQLYFHTDPEPDALECFVQRRDALKRPSQHIIWTGEWGKAYTPDWCRNNLIKPGLRYCLVVVACRQQSEQKDRE